MIVTRKKNNKKWMKEETYEMIEDESSKWYARNMVDIQLNTLEEERERKIGYQKERLERDKIESEEKKMKKYTIEREMIREILEWKEGFARIKLDKKEIKNWSRIGQTIEKAIGLQEMKENQQRNEETNRERILREEKERMTYLIQLSEKDKETYKCAGLRKKCKWWNTLIIGNSIIPEGEDGVKLRKKTIEAMKNGKEKTIHITWFGEEMRYANNKEVKSKKYALTIGNLEDRVIWLEEEREKEIMFGVGHRMNSFRGLGEDIKEYKDFIKGKITWIDTLNKELQDKRKWLPERNGEIPRKWPIVTIDRKDLEKIE